MIKRHNLKRGDTELLKKISKDFANAVKDAADLHRAVMDGSWKPKSHVNVLKAPENK